ncbi:hypothetical protein OQY15_01620 [Pedobacter sp. MC2016-15]|uniref:hypothetical protein n=1 Tax=Pedobacter sp. MC2016-15 TaxID=2994473 RepID=UPI00224619A9|nr:hypothetical protein [Pedobacter sp. MC2016-15]MCX2477767.1 hypothetical protein [Pedobacter sp. MC2016-15]
MKKHIITYGDDAYRKQREFLAQTALSSQFFDNIRIFTPDDIGHEFIEQVEETIKMPKGGGYWLWKPYIIKQTLDSIDEDDILVYCDAGCMVNDSGRKRFEEYLEMLRLSTTGTVDFELPLEEFRFTKKEIFDYFDTPAESINSNQLMATVVLLRKCAHSVMLVNEWYETACDNPFLFTDEIIVNTQHPDYQANRYDQSVFSIIRKQNGCNPIADETYFLDFLRQGWPFPFWATRFRI